MGFRVITDSNINSKELQAFLVDELTKSSSFVFLTATASLKAMRLASTHLSQHLKSEENTFSVDEFIRGLSIKIFQNKTHLSTADQKYILSRVICHYYKDDETKLNTFLNIKHDIFNLFNYLLLKEIDIKSETTKKIAEDFSPSDAAFFEIYITFKEVLHDVISALKTGRLRKRSKEILGESFMKSVRNKNVDIYINRLKQNISAAMLEVDAVFIDGFLFFNDMQEYLITAAVKQNKSVYFITKQFSDATGEFIYHDVFENLANKLSTEIELVFSNKYQPELKTALDTVRAYYPPLPNKKQVSDGELSDGSIRFISPFINREEELRYIVNSISEMLEDNYNGNLSETIALLNDIAIVIAVNKEKYEERISNLFRERGLFVFKGQDNIENTPFATVDTSSFVEVYFSRDDFMKNRVCFTDGRELSQNDKYDFFYRCYDRIQINSHYRPISSYPIGQFVLQLYNSIQHGMSIEGFKGVLYSNWRYNLGDVSVKWSDFISDFKYIELWLVGKTDLDDWQKTTEKLIVLKAEIKDNPLYIYHPLTAVNEDSLIFFNSLLTELRQMQESIKSVFGGIDKHLEVLKNIIMKADKLLSFNSDELEFEQNIMRRLVAAISDISSSSFVNNLDSRYFAENIKAMLVDYENELSIENENKLSLSIVNLENMRPFKYCFFPMCESNKYPRRYLSKYPYTKNIIRIMTSDKYDIGGVSNSIIDFNYYMKLESYFMKNVLDFTGTQLIITFAEKEYDSKNKISIFAEDLATILDEVIPYERKNETEQIDGYSFNDTAAPIAFDKKSEYTLTELAIFKLCPKLYFHREADGKGAFLSRLQLKFYAEAVMYCDLFRRFMDYNLEHKKVYVKDENTYLTTIRELHRITISENRPYFSFMSNYEIEDIARNIYNKMLSFIENSKQYLKGNAYTVITHSNKEYEGDGYKLIVEHDNRFVDYDLKTWRMSQNSTYLEFLVLKTTDGKSELKHYAEMIQALDRNDPNEDRVNLIARIIAKINIQFDSKRFADDGIKRTDELVSQVCGYDFGRAAPMSSEYCTYCRLNDICMGR